MLKVKATYVKDRQNQAFMTKTKTIVGFARELNPPTFRVKRFGNAQEVRFRFRDTSDPNATEQNVTVYDYFRNHHGITLQNPNLPVLTVGTRADPQYMPPSSVLFFQVKRIASSSQEHKQVK
jgi:hypothetical protein